MTRACFLSLNFNCHVTPCKKERIVMTTPDDAAAANATEMVQGNRRICWPWLVAAVVCAGIFVWCWAALNQPFQLTWDLTHNIPDVYGWHETIFSPDGARIVIGFRGKCKVIDLASGKEIFSARWV